MRLLVFGHWSDTGFGVVTQQLTTRFLAAGVDVRVIAVNYRQTDLLADARNGAPMAGRVWPASLYNDGHGGNWSHEAATGEAWQTMDRTDTWKPDVVLMIADTGSLLGYLGRPRVKNDPYGPFGRDVPTLNYLPIEGADLPPSWRAIWSRIRPVAMSAYGQRVISEHMGEPVPLIYHGVDTTTFHPVDMNDPITAEGKTYRSREAAKVAFGFAPDRTIVFRHDRLVERKQYHNLLRAMVPVFAARPEVDLVIHCYPMDDGLNLYEDIARLVPTEYLDRVRLTNAHDTWKGLPSEGLALLLNAADIYVSTTGGEGFGLCLAEAAACEVPVITTDHAAGPEVVGPGGILIPPLVDAYGDMVVAHNRYGMAWAYSDYRAFTPAIMRLVERPALRRELGRAGRRHVASSFSWDTAAEQFLALLAAEVAA